MNTNTELSNIQPSSTLPIESSAQSNDEATLTESKTTAAFHRIKDLFICPLSLEMPAHPVTTSCRSAHMFERTWIANWIIHQQNSSRLLTCPSCKDRITDQLRNAPIAVRNTLEILRNALDLPSNLGDTQSEQLELAVDLMEAQREADARAEPPIPPRVPREELPAGFLAMMANSAKESADACSAILSFDSSNSSTTSDSTRTTARISARF